MLLFLYVFVYQIAMNSSSYLTFSPCKNKVECNATDLKNYKVHV